MGYGLLAIGIDGYTTQASDSQAPSVRSPNV